jgi:hypothetical protein
MKVLIILVALCACTFSSASVSDISGTWKASTETPNGTFETTFTFKVDGTKLSGTTSNQMLGELPFTDGKIDGDTITFLVSANFNGNDVKMSYKGKVAGEEIKLTLELVGMDRTFEMTAKKVS